MESQRDVSIWESWEFFLPPPLHRKVTCWSLNIFQRGKNCRIWTTAKPKFKSKVFSGNLAKCWDAFHYILLLRRGKPSSPHGEQPKQQSKPVWSLRSFQFQFSSLEGFADQDSRTFFFSPSNHPFNLHYWGLSGNPVLSYIILILKVSTRAEQNTAARYLVRQLSELVLVCWYLSCYICSQYCRAVFSQRAVQAGMLVLLNVIYIANTAARYLRILYYSAVFS